MIEFRGRIELIIGPMLVGETTELLRRLKRWELAKKSVCLIKYEKDVRYGNNSNWVTHD
jgi:thymidine kinase